MDLNVDFTQKVSLMCLIFGYTKEGKKIHTKYLMFEMVKPDI